MDLVSEYRRQYGWRDWPAIYAVLPDLAGADVLDLGCGVGDQARDLATRGARVVGIDGNADLVAHARSRHIPNAEFRLGDLRHVEGVGSFDGIWASFSPAYFPDFAPVLSSWCRWLRPGGWMALVEMAGLFSHDPLPVECHEFSARFAKEAAAAGGYDFDMGARLAGHIQAAGLNLAESRIVPDAELSFAGSASAEVMQAWTDRLDRMQALRRRSQIECPSFRAAFLACLSSESHVSRCQVHVCLARRD